MLRREKKSEEENMTIPIISSTSNAQVKQLIQLQKKAKLRAEQDVFIVEGIKMYQEVPQKRLVHTYASESFYNKKRERGASFSLFSFVRGKSSTVVTAQFGGTPPSQKSA